MTTKTAAQQRADRIKAFNAELAKLAEDNVLALTTEQRQAVDDHHAVPDDGVRGPVEEACGLEGDWVAIQRAGNAKQQRKERLFHGRER